MPTAYTVSLNLYLKFYYNWEEWQGERRGWWRGNLTTGVIITVLFCFVFNEAQELLPTQGQEQENNYTGICLSACTFSGFLLGEPGLTAVGTRQSQEEGRLTQKEETQHRTHLGADKGQYALESLGGG